MGLSSRSRLILLASHRMVLTRERKNSSRIAREIEIFSIFAFFSIARETQHAKSVTQIIYLGPLPIGPPQSPCWSQSKTLDFKFSTSHSVDHDDQLTFIKHFKFSAKNIAVSSQNVVSVPCSETGPNFKTSLFVDPWL